MPQLPSGRHIGLDPAPLAKMVSDAEAGKFVLDLMAIKHPEDALRRIGVLYFRPKVESDRGMSLSELSNLPPEDLEPYPSGFNVVTIKSEFDQWSPEDQSAFIEFLRADRTSRFMDSVLAAIRKAQDRLVDNPSTLPGLLATWWNLGIHPLQEERMTTHQRTRMPPELTGGAPWTDLAPVFARCADLIRAADGLLIGAGAGMGVDSGLPDFRGDHGFWNAYPALGRAKIAFYDVASPATFESDPRLAWGFYGHRLQLYRSTTPHAGFGILQEIGARLRHGAFVFTSNVDGHFQAAGFDPDRIDECHGSIHHLQCLDACAPAIWPADLLPEVDADACRLTSDLPRCLVCDGIARPNILMFGDWNWVKRRELTQARNYANWRAKVESLVVIELGAGTDIPSVRSFCERQGGPIIRINPREPSVGRRAGVGLPMGALKALRGIRAALVNDSE